MKRYMHEDHGFHIPLDPQEEKTMLASGWKLDDGKALKEKLALVQADAIQQAVRRGRPPKTEE